MTSARPPAREDLPTGTIARRGRPLALVLAATLALGMAAPARALDPDRRITDYSHDVWTMTEGLPHEGITSVLQARDGYLWVGTLDGPARFDGVRFEVFNLIEAASVPTNVVVAMAEAADGALWLGTRDGLVRYAGGRFTAIGTRDGLTSAAVRALLVAPDGALWVGTRFGGLNRIHEGRVTAVTTAQGLRHDDVRSLALDPSGGLWVGTAAGLHFVEGGRATAVDLGPSPQPPLVSALRLDRRGTLWVGTSDALWEVPEARRWREAGGRVPAVRRHAGTEVRALLEDEHGSLWAGLGQGLLRARGDRVEVAAERDGLSHHHVRALATDREGNLWLGTDGGGLNRWRDTSVVLLPDAAMDASLLAVLHDGKGGMWTGGNCGGAARWRGGEVLRLTQGTGLPNDCVQSLARDAQGGVWIGTLGGAARWQDGQFTARYSTRTGLAHDHVMSIAVARRGDVWFGTGGAGAQRLTPGGGLTRLDTSSGLGHDDVRAIMEGRDGTIWIGTLGGGITRWREGEISRISRAEGLSSDHVLALHEDADGTVWIGTNGGGLNRLRGGTFAHFGRSRGLPGDAVFRILDDGRGALWMSSHRGVFRITRQQLEDVADGRAARLSPDWFGRAEGLPRGGALGGTQPAGDLDDRGRLWFPTIRGPAIIDPGRLVRNGVPPPVIVERVRVDGVEAAPAALARLGPGVRDLEIDYTALSFVAPAQVRFRYRLVGFDEQWVEAGARRTAYFTNLPPGAYRFQVVASNNDGVWNEDGAAIAFVLRPRVYQTRAFLAAVVVLGVLGAWAGVAARERRLRRRQQELARQVEQALAEVKVLSGLLPICAACKRIKDQGDQWRPLETYIQQHSQADFTHGICPECLQRLYPGE